MSAACEDTSRASVHPMPIGGICCSRLHPAGYGNGPSLLTLAVTKRSTADRRHPALRCRDQNKIADELSNEALDGASWAGGLKLPDVRPSVVLFWKFAGSLQLQQQRLCAIPSTCPAGIMAFAAKWTSSALHQVQPS